MPSNGLIRGRDLSVVALLICESLQALLIRWSYLGAGAYLRNFTVDVLDSLPEGSANVQNIVGELFKKLIVC